MIGTILATVGGFVGGGYVVLSMWAIASQNRLLAAEQTTTAKQKADLATLSGAVLRLQGANTSLADEIQTCKDVARNALAREAATNNRPIFLRPEEALVMAQTIGSMLDKAQRN